MDSNASWKDDPARPGKVWLVGAGPGDPELLTQRAARLIAQARVVLYDQLIGAEVLALLPPGARSISVGKRCGHHSVPQELIIRRLIAEARRGENVVRLKGGDPCIFGRGGEEAEALAQAGIPFEIVPGISAAQGACASLGIPLTHRAHAASVIFATGHFKEGDTGEPDWPTLARSRQTVVFYMGLGALAQICSRLQAHGLPAAHPAAVIERGTLPGQRIIAGTLDTLPMLADAACIASPALVVVGQVVAQHQLMQERSSAACECTDPPPVRACAH